MARATPKITDGALTYRDAMHTHTIVVESAPWWQWLAAQTSTTFRFEHPLGNFTARRERKRDGWYWYAYCKRGGALQKAYLGKSSDLTLDRLQAVAVALAQPSPAAGAGTPATQDGLLRTGSVASRLHDPLVTTKLALPPARTALVSRPRLMDRLETALQRKLTLIAAPAGYGKTTLVSAWHMTATGRAWPLAWVSLDPSDNDPVRFWTYAIAALQTLHPALGADALTLLQSPSALRLTEVLTLLINALAALPAPVALVLDDYHVVTNSAIHQGLTFLLDHQPPQLHLVIISRADPPLPLMRLRARGELTDLRAADLGFSINEVETFFNQVLELRVGADDIAALTARTEGWIAGLVLVAHALPAHGDAAVLIRERTRSHRFILDYLVEDVLQQQPAHIQRFLLDTVILSRLSASLCDALVFGDDAPSVAPSSQLVLDELERKNLFLVPLDGQGRWYRYHQLFAELLRGRAQQLQPERLPILHRRASAWYKQQGFSTEAVEHALAAGDMVQAADLIEQIVEATFFRGEVQTLLIWLGALPLSIVHARTRLALAHAWTLAFIGQVETAEARLQDVGQRMQQAAVADRPLLGGATAALQAIIASQRGDMPGLIALAHEALAAGAPESSEPRSLSLLALGLAHFFSGDLEAAHQALATVIATRHSTDTLLPAMLAIYILADVQRHQGQLSQAAEVLQRGGQLGTGADGQPLPIAGLASIGLGEVLRERNDLDAAMRHLRAGIALAKQGGLHLVVVDGIIALARVLQACGDGEGALAVLHEFEAQVHDSWVSPWHRVQLAACQARLWLAQGHLARASHWAQDYAAHLDADALNLRPLIKYGFAHTTLARVRVGEGKADEAAHVLARLLVSAETGGWRGDVAEILVLQALALQAQGSTTQALHTLERALGMAETGGYVRLFVDEGAPMAALLAKMGEAGGKMRAYMRILLTALEKPEAGHPASFRAQSMVDSLSTRELEVLHLLAAGMESPEIARTLIIGVSTVRSHLKNIYSKLAVHGRVQAIERARTLGLLRPS